LLLSGAIVSAATPAAMAQTPLSDQPIRLVVTFSAGGTVDIAARTMAAALSKSLNESVIVIDKPGAGGNIAAMYVAQSSPDSITLLVTSVNHFVNPIIFGKAGYELNDFVLISELTTMPYAFVVPANSKFNNLGDLATFAKANPGKLSWGFGGIGSPGHFFGIEFEQAAKVRTNPINYKGGAELLTAINGGQLDLVVMSADTSLPLIREKKLKAIATTGEARNPTLPNVPTASEELPSYVPLTGYALLAAPRTLPKATLVRLNAEVSKILATPDYQKYLSRSGSVVRVTPSLASAKAFFDQDGARWQTVAKASALKVQ
jgi:tripartite-type tricarboxylate transporter receptor subunit TctC